MNDKSLNNLKTLWEKFDENKTDDKENKKKDKSSLVNGIVRYKKNSKCWVPPNFAKLPVHEDDSKSSSKLFSMAYNEEEKKNHNSLNVNLFNLYFIFIN